MRIQSNKYLQLTPSQILRLEHQGCYAADWSLVTIHKDSDLSLIRSSRFYGAVRIGELTASPGRKTGIFNSVIENCRIGNRPYISNIGGILQGIVIGNEVTRENCGRITADPEADCALGHPVAVLDETGSRPVPLYPALTSQIATLFARYPRIAEHHLLPLLKETWDLYGNGARIGDHAVVRDCTEIHNVWIDSYVHVAGATYLSDGRVINNAGQNPYAYIGSGVNAKNFMIVDGRVDAGCLLRNCFVGQGVELSKGFSAHDSLFFANSSCECGEACAIIAGPYTVTMHKSSLLIGAEYSFMNAGSGTNSSNHMYKLGPVHWGTMHRGVKTASGAYMMWEGEIGAYSLLMGAHKSHPNTSMFPFSYLFGNPDGKTIVAPALMLRSCGLMRDKIKWPNRDRRKDAKLPLHDNIHFEVLSPVTVQLMLSALPLLEQIAAAGPEAGKYVEYGGVLISPKAAARGIEIYTQAIVIYLHRILEQASEHPEWQQTSLVIPEKWIDLGGQIIPAYLIDQIKEAESFSEVTELIQNAYRHFPELEYQWVKSILTPAWEECLRNVEDYSRPFHEAIEADRQKSLDSIK